MADFRSSSLFTVFKYLFFGGSAFLIDFGVLYLCVSWFGFSAWVGALVAFVVSTLYAFFTQMRFTFSHRMTGVAPVVKYLVLLGVNIVFTAFVVQLFEDFWDLYLVGKVVATVCVTLWNFPIMKFWVFPRNIS